MSKLSEKALYRRKVKAMILAAIHEAGERLINNRDAGLCYEQHTCNILYQVTPFVADGVLKAYTLTFRNHMGHGDAWVHHQYRLLGWWGFDTDKSTFNEHVHDHRLMLLATFHELIRSGEIKLEDYINGL